MRDSDWSRANLLRSDWLLLKGAIMTTPRLVRAITRGGLEPSLTGYVISQITEDDWERGCQNPRLSWITLHNILSPAFLKLFSQKTKRKPWAYNKKNIPFSKVLDAVDISIPRENICPEQGNDAEKLVG